jgi:phage baseplate assembly protein W
MKYIFQNNITNESLKGIGINIPFNGSTGINTTYTSKDAIRANLLNFLLTGTRERILKPNFGSSIKDQIFENITQDKLSEVNEIIQFNIENYFPSIKLEELNIIPDNNIINIYIKYSIKNTNIQDDIQINFNNE